MAKEKIDKQGTDDKEIKSKQKEQEKQLKDKIEKDKKKIKAEKSRIQDTINFPFKLLFNASAIIGILAFFIQFFANTQSLINSISNGFIVFSSIYLGSGIVLLIIILVMADNRKKEEIERKKAVEEKRRVDSDQRMADQERIEDEMKRYRQNNESRNPENMSEATNLS